ncbi:uncharacterized protein BO72DRAFT_492006 [Aspergillus fijiensis CBS 313.89]|uniref:Uncharacterized protein n=1 Tax=Aspergillus fijiensis CBS 313.89 TaxID=1448319 RepID=A0A8G1RZR7_9EURO|nr:uncharacterized protein BO72DRAFT_492006 [Aspergillus fijiensis CBS 313.89]RAK81777.1 hypothetical protein BO72DRAFT_492006 [Aspergillus fijiensis CBS 313.89]
MAPFHPWLKAKYWARRLMRWGRPDPDNPQSFTMQEWKDLGVAAEEVAQLMDHGYVSVAFNSLTMAQVQFYFGIPREPLPMILPPLDTPIPDALLREISMIAIDTERAGDNEARSRAMLNAIFMGALRYRRPLAPIGARRMRLGFETPLSTIFKEAPRVVISGQSDYSIFYDEHDDVAKQVIIIEAKKLGSGQAGLPQLLGYLGSVQFSRRSDGRAKAPLFGVLTDSEEFVFIVLHENMKYSKKTFHWKEGDAQRIWSLLVYMIKTMEIRSREPSDEDQMLQ